MAILGTVTVTSIIAPTSSADTYPVIDPLYGIDGLRSVADSIERNAIPDLRRREGMLVYQRDNSTYYKLLTSPWVGNDTDWSVFNSGSASISGTPTQVSFWGEPTSLTGDTNFNWDNTGKTLVIGSSASTPSSSARLYLNSNSDNADLFIETPFNQRVKFKNSTTGVIWHTSTNTAVYSSGPLSGQTIDSYNIGRSSNPTINYFEILPTGKVKIGSGISGVLGITDSILLEVGLEGTRTGNIKLLSQTSGSSVTIEPFNSGSTWTLTLPENGGLANQVLTTDGSGSTFWSNTSIVSYWTSGSSGSFSVKTINDSGLDATGDYSLAQGAQTLSSGIASHAEGFRAQSIGNASHAEGDSTIANGESSHAEGDTTIASGRTSHAEGITTIASGLASHSEGINTLAIGDYSHAKGSGTTASGIYSSSSGRETVASGIGSYAEGNTTISSDQYSHAEGNFTQATNRFAHAEGNSTIASGLTSHAEGTSTIAGGNSSHAEGTLTKALGASSHAEGNSTTASGTYSHSQNFETLASGLRAHSEGNATSATTTNSHAQGNETLANGVNSFCGGDRTNSSGLNSVALGIFSTASGTNSFVFGSGSTASGGGSIVLGSGITGTTDDTVYVNDLVITKLASVPSSSADSVGENGSITWDNNYFYWKANGQWLRISGSTF